MCRTACIAQCETTQTRRTGKGAALFGYTKLYGRCPGGQAEYLRVPRPSSARSKSPEGSA